MTKILIATGGTGGHIIPARSLASKLCEKNFKVIIAGDNNICKYNKFHDKFIIKTINCSQIRPGLKNKIFAAIKIAIGIIKSLFLILKFRPKKIIAFGGYATFPILIAAVILRKRIIIHEQNAVLGRVNKIFAKYAQKVALSFEQVDIDDQLKSKTIFTGIPIRDEILQLNKKQYQLPQKITGKERKNMGYSGLILASEYDNFDEYFDKNEHFKILVIGGSGGAEIFSKILPNAFFNLSEEFKNNIHIFQQCRKDLLQETFDIYEKYNLNIEIDSFFNDMESKIAESHLIITRAGSSSIHEFLVAKKPMIIVPLANSADNHQQKNAEIFVKNKSAIILEEQNFDVRNICKVITQLMSKDKKLINISKDCENYANKHLDACSNLIKIINE